MPLFSLGFRPFYLGAASWATIAIPLWLLQYLWGIGAPTSGSAIAWHAHEMVFGFQIAVVTGFLFTAARNWTGLPTPRGVTLAVFIGVWLTARILMLTGPSLLAAIVDIALLPAVAFALWLPLHRSNNRNQFFVALLLLLACANTAFHLARTQIIDSLDPLAIVRFSLYLVAFIVMIMAGRVIPSFTRNAIRTARSQTSPQLDRAALGVAALALLAWLVDLNAWANAALCAIASVLHAVRLWKWDPLATRGDPILWILHGSYAWIPIAFMLMAVASMSEYVPRSLPDHAISLGAVGGTILGMITRTARGHTGRPLRVGALETASYVLVMLAAFARVIVPLALPDIYRMAVVASGLLWSAAFLLYLIVYIPMLCRTRADGRPE